MSTSSLNKEQKKKLLAAALKKLEQQKRDQCFDPVNMDTRPTEAQQAVLDDLGSISHRYVVAGNQGGKSQLGAREVTWIFNDNHPKWKRPKEWGEEPLVLIVVGRTSKQYMEVLWRKIKSFLTPGEYTAHNQAGVLQKVTHNNNGNTIIFASHHADNEAREKLQAFVAHYVWVDEMPKSVYLLEELHRRVQAKNGYFLATFTPKVFNEQIKKLVDSSELPVAKKYRLSMLDNPIYHGREDEILSQLSTYSDSYRNTILYGDWSLGEDAVYDFESEVHVEVPPNYSPAWRHVESVDPAVKSKFGFTLWAECPENGIWYCVKAKYLEGMYNPVEIVQAVLKETAGVNIVRRIYDPHERWYMGTASGMGVKPAYIHVHDKTGRKGDLIKQLQYALGVRIKIAPWCSEMIDEFTSCRWSETADNKIVNSSSYHLLDSAQYFVDLIPTKIAPVQTPSSWQDWLYQQNEKRKSKEQAKVSRGRVQRRRRGII